MTQSKNYLKLDLDIGSCLDQLEIRPIRLISRKLIKANVSIPF